MIKLPNLNVEYILFGQILIETFILSNLVSSELWTMMMSPGSLENVGGLVVIV